MRSKILITIVVVAAIVGIGVGVGLLASRGPGTSHPATGEESTPNTETHQATTAAHSAAPSQNPSTEVKPMATNELITLMQTSNIAAAATNLMATDTNWEDKIEDIVGSDDPDTNKVKQLFALFPTLPPDGQEEAVQHLSNLVEDDDYSPLGDLLKNPKLPEGVLDELLADVLNRPNNMKLPLLADVASDPDHAKRDEAKDLIELYLGVELPTKGGTPSTENATDSAPIDWEKVKILVKDWLKDNPD